MAVEVRPLSEKLGMRKQIFSVSHGRGRGTHQRIMNLLVLLLLPRRHGGGLTETIDHSHLSCVVTVHGIPLARSTRTNASRIWTTPTTNTSPAENGDDRPRGEPGSVSLETKKSPTSRRSRNIEIRASYPIAMTSLGLRPGANSRSPTPQPRKSSCPSTLRNGIQLKSTPPLRNPAHAVKSHIPTHPYKTKFNNINPSWAR